MQILSFLLFFSFQALGALSYGDGSDGDCLFTGGAEAKSVWNCEDVDITGPATFPDEEVVIRAQGSVSITGSINLDGVAIGGAGVGSNGTSGGVGFGGGGGGGAGHDGIGTVGSNSGLTATSGGAGGASYGDESDFENNISVGSRGGNGGDAIAGAIVGGVGGNGGGALLIVAKDSINISGAISVDGGEGASGAADNDGGSGGGGGGSGGSMYLISNVSLEISGAANSISVAGGAGGAGGTNGLTADAGGDGGAGANGRIRFDSPVLNIAPGATPGTEATNNFVPAIYDPLIGGQKFESDIEYACSYKEGLSYEAQFVTFILSFLIIIGLGRVIRIR